MIRVYTLCEGQTEETFINQVLQPYFSPMDIFFTPILLRTSASCRGGAVSYGKIKHQITRLCRQDNSAWVTTMIDYYGRPSDFPNNHAAQALADPYERVAILENAFHKDIQEQNFIPNLILHEFEALLFSDTNAFSGCFEESIVDVLQQEKQGFLSPEHMNESPHHAPSKRILRHCERYNKPLHGSLIAQEMGLETIRQACLHFDAWLHRLENLQN